ncbi:Protein FAM136A [Rhynchospora pubera]|uniref:Protein FAM136A n=1 Tax=Rhynchospora pubera TaxID=906938 RepID=A0AAV8DH80_9POAL|nr:Protein FAM136A [Rhynchospora pubera]KAJ4766776.1 Protein FAM136A [Rhynchospora pubera]KAJ4795672.1 Protein FAM136A [Rhynchospora pubera]
MDHLAAVEERIVTERIKKKLDEVNAAAQEQLASVQDHVNFTLQKAYFKCAYECFDRSRKQEEISNCVENCSVPVLNANNFVESEMAKFQERMNRSLMVCQDRFENAKLQKIKTEAINELELCVSQAIDDSKRVLPHIADRIKSSLSMS